MITQSTWSQISFAAIFAALFFFVLAAIIAYCVCWRNKGKTNLETYILDESGLRKVDKTHGTFYRFASVTNFDVFKRETGNASENDGTYYNWAEDSTDTNGKFDSVVLKVEIGETSGGKRGSDDMVSCCSSESKNSFYSMYPMTRSTSVADTYKSIQSDSESI